MHIQVEVTNTSFNTTGKVIGIAYWKNYKRKLSIWDIPQLIKEPISVPSNDSEGMGSLQ